MALGLSMGNLEVHVLAHVDSFKAGIKSAVSTVKMASAQIRSVGYGMTAAITAPLTALGVSAVRTIAEFDDAMTKSLAIMGNVSEDMRKEMEATALQLSTETTTSAKEAAEAYFFLASAGLNAAQSVAALPVVNKFAVAGNFEMAQATDLVTDAQSALGLTVKDTTQNMQNMARVSDVLVKANTLANASVEQFSTALTAKAATAMKSYNIEMEEGVAVLAAYADQGIKAQLAGNTFDRMMRLLIRNVNDNEEAFRRFNIRTKDADGNLVPLADIIEDMTRAFDGMGSTQKAAALELLGFEARSQQAILPLLGLSDNLRRYQKELEDAGGITDIVANRNMKSLAAQFKILQNRVDVMYISFKDELEPSLITVIDKLSTMVDYVRNLDSTTKKWIAVIGVAAAALGPLLIMVGLVVPGLATLVGLLSISNFAFVGALGLLVASLGLLWDALDDGKLQWAEFIGNFRLGNMKIITALDITATYILQAWEWVTKTAANYWESFKLSVMEIGGIIWRFMLKVGNGISKGFWWSVRKVVEAFAWLSKQTLEIGARIGLIDESQHRKGMDAIKELEKGAKGYGKTATQVYEKEIADSLKKSESRWGKYFKTVTELEKEYTEKSKLFEQARAMLLEEDQRELRGEEGKKWKDQYKKLYNEMIDSMQKDIDKAFTPDADVTEGRTVTGFSLSKPMETRQRGAFSARALNNVRTEAAVQKDQLAEQKAINHNLRSVIKAIEKSGGLG